MRERNIPLTKEIIKLIEEKNRSAFFYCPLHSNFSMKRERVTISFHTFVAQQSESISKEKNMNDSEDTSGSSITSLIVFRENGDTDNLFVPVLCDAIRMTGVDVRCSTKEFWESDKTYDIIHFQWPEEVVGRTCDDPGIVRRLEERIAFFRSRGTHFVYTRHNVRPHYANEVISRAYDIIESQSDVVVHMGRFSLEEFVGKHPDSRNAIILHHIYQYTYQEDISVERARQYLQLPQEAFIVTAFGKFRNREEIRIALGTFRSWNEKQKLLLAPRLYPFSRRNNYGRNFLKRWASRVGYYLLIPLLNRVIKLHAGANDELIDNCDLPYYMAASNVIFIQRKDILNSGNVPLAFLYHKVVVGPKVGNIGELLEATGNPTFCPNNKKDILRALKEARRLSIQGQGERNYSYAMKEMNICKVGLEYVQAYKNAING